MMTFIRHHVYDFLIEIPKSMPLLDAWWLAFMKPPRSFTYLSLEIPLLAQSARQCRQYLKQHLLLPNAEFTLILIWMNIRNGANILSITLPIPNHHHVVSKASKLIVIIAVVSTSLFPQFLLSANTCLDFDYRAVNDLIFRRLNAVNTSQDISSRIECNAVPAINIKMGLPGFMLTRILHKPPAYRRFFDIYMGLDIYCANSQRTYRPRSTSNTEETLMLWLSSYRFLSESSRFRLMKRRILRVLLPISIFDSLFLMLSSIYAAKECRFIIFRYFDMRIFLGFAIPAWAIPRLPTSASPGYTPPSLLPYWYTIESRFSLLLLMVTYTRHLASRLPRSRVAAQGTITFRPRHHAYRHAMPHAKIIIIDVDYWGFLTLLLYRHLRQKRRRWITSMQLTLCRRLVLKLSPIDITLGIG